MEIEIIEKDEYNLKFLLKGVSPAFANALRRVILAEVPTMAIKEVIFLENNTALYDEILAHRLGLIPLKTDIDRFNLPSECECGGTGCSLCEITLTLEKEATEDHEILYSGDLQSLDPGTEPVHKDIPIVTMLRGQRVLIEANASLGQGKDHAKWQPVSTVAYKYVPHVEFDQEKCTYCHECADKCPRNIIKIENDEKIYVTDNLECILCQLCVEVCEDDAVEVKTTGDEFLFKVESTGALPAEKIVTKAIEILERKSEEFLSEIALIE